MNTKLKLEPTKFILTKRGLVYTLSCNGNELTHQQFYTPREAQEYYRGYISSWDRAVLTYEGEEDELL